MEHALTAYTSAVAEQAFAGQGNAPWGTIGVGASADLVWLASDPRTVSALDVPGIVVRGTFLQGRAVHSAT
jgi:predicted amidohydrolase YtcJ